MKAHWIIALFVSLFVSPLCGQSLIPDITLGEEFKLTMTGFTQTHYREQAEEDQFDWARFRMFPKLSHGDHFKVTSGLELVDFDKKDSNWLLWSQIEYHVDDSLSFRAGRLFLASGFATPPPFLLETVNYPRSPRFNFYAWGAQAYKKWDFGLSLMSDVSFRSDVPFDDSRAFDGWESSHRLEQKFDTLSVAFTTEFSDDFGRLALDFTHEPTEQVFFKGTAYGSVSKDDDFAGGFLFGAYRPFDFLELHGQFDGGRNFTERSDYQIVTGGLRLIAPRDQLSFTLDYEHHVEDSEASGLFARVQFRF